MSEGRIGRYPCIRQQVEYLQENSNDRSLLTLLRQLRYFEGIFDPDYYNNNLEKMFLLMQKTMYVQNVEAGIQPTDPRIGISWPLNISEVSVRDLAHPLLNEQFLGIPT
jgi:hypothetical protein